jgi:hypothetical protein
MAIRYSGHLLKTRQQALWQGLVLLIVLVPLAAWRFRTEDTVVAAALAALTLAPFVLAYQAWRFLGDQERRHPEPTPEMAFVFRILANVPLTMGALLLILLVELR